MTSNPTPDWNPAGICGNLLQAGPQPKITARPVWTSERPGEEKVVSIAMGSVSELPETGNVLVGYGAVLEDDRLDEINWETRARIGQYTLMRELTHTDPAEVVWEMRLEKTGTDPEIGWVIFGAKRVRRLVGAVDSVGAPADRR